MASIFEAYNDFFNNPDAELMKKNMESLNTNADFLNVEMIDEKVLRAARLVSAYLERYGLDCDFVDGMYKGSNIVNTLISSYAYARLSVREADIDRMVEAMNDASKFPPISYNNADTRYDAVMCVEVGKNQKNEILKMGAELFVYGFAVSDYKAIKSLQNTYLTTATTAQASIYVSIGKSWLNSIITDIYRTGISVADWCVQFDGCLVDVSNQISEGFVVIPCNKDNKSLICISTIYSGEYFIVNAEVFRELYENDVLKTIKFAQRKVSVISIDRATGKKGEVMDRIITVPVYFDDDNEKLVSDLVSTHFNYHEIFTHDLRMAV